MVAQQLGVDLEGGLLRIGVGMVFHHRRMGGAEVGAGLVESYAGGEAAEELGHAMDATGDHGGGEMVLAGDDVGDDLGVGGIRYAGFQHADDGGGARVEAIEADLFADDGGIAVEHGAPETIRENHGAGGLGAVVAHVQKAAEHRVQAHDVEVGAADDAGADLAGLAEAHHGEADGGEVAEGGDRLDAGAKVLDLRHGEDGVLLADAGLALADVDQAVLVAVDKGAEKDAADQGKDGGVGANAEGQSQYHGDGKPWGARKGAQREFQIVKEHLWSEGHRASPSTRAIGASRGHSGLFLQDATAAQTFPRIELWTRSRRVAKLLLKRVLRWAWRPPSLSWPRRKSVCPSYF